MREKKEKTTEDMDAQKRKKKEKTTEDRDVQKMKKNKEKEDDKKRVGSPVVDLRQSLLNQADGQPPEGRQSKGSADKLDMTVSNVSKESRDLVESTVGRPHPREPRSDVEEGKQKSDQAAGNRIASRIERDKSQVGYFACDHRTGTVHICSSCRRHSYVPVGRKRLLYLMHQH